MKKEELNKLKGELAILKEEKKTNPELKGKYDSLYQKIYYQTKNDQIKAVQLAYREDKKEKLALDSKKYYEENKDTKIRDYREDNKDRLKEYRDNYYVVNREQCLANVKANQAKKKAENNGK